MPLSRSSLFADLDVEVHLDAPLGPLTWFGVGGRADVLIRPRTIEALATLVRRAHRQGETIHILGSGANLLVADAGIDGVVIHLETPLFKAATFEDEAGDPVLRAMAGADLPKTLNETVRRGFEGLSHLAGIPASIGGAVRMNAGGRFGSTGDSVRSVLCMTRQGEMVAYQADQLKFDYRATNIPDPIILGATFNLTPADPIGLRERVKEIFSFKKSTQPLADHSAGCTFKNPIDPVTEQRVSAGKLIDEAGLKGMRIGGAVVSHQHANFIACEAGARADEVIELLERIRAKVYEVHGIELQTEVAIWRRGNDS